MKIAYIKWVDSTEYKKLRVDDPPEDPPVIETAGILAHDEPEYVTVAFYKNHTLDHFTPSVTIPRCSIKLIEIFEV